jgi:hypothetical protein
MGISFPELRQKSYTHPPKWVDCRVSNHHF